MPQDFVLYQSIYIDAEIKRIKECIIMHVDVKRCTIKIISHPFEYLTELFSENLLHAMSH